jgi:alpha-galactosidase
MKRSNLFFCAAVLITAALPVFGQADLTGFWVFRTPTGDGYFRESFLDLKQEGEQITGKVIQGKRQTPISEGTFKDGKLHFVVKLPGPNNSTRQIVYDGRAAEGGKLTLSTAFPGRNPVVGEMERSKPEAALPPPRLPLPGLHDVPDNGLVRTPPMGWNSWNKFAGRVTDADVRGMADAMVSSGMSKVGYIYINIDDTWEGPRDAAGNITTNRKFPDMKALADYVHSKGLKIGIYSSPGPKTCAGYEGTYGHEEQDARQWAAWGFDYVKYDWCSAADIYKDEEMRAVYQKMGDALLKSGRPIVYSLCQYGRAEVWTWGPKVGGNLWRTTGDISDRWASLDRIGFGQAVPGRLTQLDIAPSIKPGAFNDPDMLEIGNGGMTGDEYRLHMSLWSLLAAPLLAGNDLRTMTDEIKSILMNTEVIAIDQDKAVKPARKISEQGTSLVLARPLADNAVAVGLFNRGEDPAQISVSWVSIGLAGKKVRARDLWARKDIPVSGDQFTATVPKHGVVLLKASAN